MGVRIPAAMYGYLCEVHRVTDYAQCHTTDVNDLTWPADPITA